MFDKGRLGAALTWLLLGWTIVVSTRYVLTILKSLQHPFNPGDEVIFVSVWLGVAVLILCSLAIHQKIATLAWAIIIGSIALAVPILSGSLVAAVLAVWISVVVTRTGYRILSFLEIALPKAFADRIAIAFPLGFAAIGFLTLAVALTGQLTPTIMWIVLILMTVAESKNAAMSLRDTWNTLSLHRLTKYDLESRALFLLLSFAFVVNLTWSIAPEVQFDALNYHLAVPRIYLESHGLTNLSYFFHSYFAHLGEMVFAFCMALHSEIVAKLVVALMGLISASAVYSLGRMLFTPRVGIWAAAFFYTTPLTSWLTGTAHTDLMVTLFVTAGLIALLNWNRTRNTRWLIAAGLLTGGGVAVKLNAMYAAIGMGVVVIGMLIATRAPLLAKLRVVVALVVPAALVALPWYLITYVHTGNPVFPMLNGIFKSPETEPINMLMNASQFGIGTSIGAFLRIPFRLSLDTSRFGEALPAGGLGPMLLFLIPFGLIAVFKNSEARIVAVTAAVYFCLWAQTFQYGRYYLVVLPVVAILAVAGVEFAADRRRVAQTIHWSALLILLIVQLTVLSIRYWNIRERFPVEFAFGQESRESFLTRAVGGWQAAALVNKSTVPGNKVLGIDTENLRFYVKIPLESLAESPITSELRNLNQAVEGVELSRTLAGMNIAYILASTAAVARPPDYYPYLTRDFLENYASLEYKDEFVGLYRLKTASDTRRP